MRISNLQKAMGSFSLNIDSLDINSPGIYGLIGPNGCGKTTAAKLIAGLLPRDAGEIDYEGISARDITMLAKKPYLMRDTVYNNLVYPLKVRGIKPDAAVCMRYLQIAGLYEKKKQQVRSLSSGEQQKLALVRTMIFDPKLVIVDEALTDLDIESLDIFERHILDTQKTHRTIWLLISHQLPHIHRLCEYIFFMSGGRLVDKGSANAMLRNPVNSLLRQYLKHEIIDMGV